MQDFPRLACYQLLRKLGDGATSTVYLAQSRMHGERCAVKVFKALLGSGVKRLDQASKLQSRELEILSILDHPNLIHLLDFGQTLDSNSDFLATEYIEGQDFVTASKDASQHHFYSMIVQVCRALDYLHTRGVTHGDLKPQNILVATDAGCSSNPPKVKLVDVGYARTSGDFNEPARMGSPHYLAPEVIRGERPTVASDLYSLGIILYECLVGNHPFSGGDIGAILQKHLQESPPRIEGESLRELHPIIYQLLTKNPEKRPASPSDLLRLINLISPVGQFRLQTNETWAAYLRSCPLVGREQLLSDVNIKLMEIVSQSSSPRPFSIVLKGEGGAGKSRLLREIAIQARHLGFRVLMMPAGSDIRTSDPTLGAMSLTLTPSSNQGLLLTFDAPISPTLRFVHWCKGLLSAGNFSPVLLITVDTSTSAPQDLSSLERLLGHFTNLAEVTVPPLEEAHIRDVILRALGLTTIDDKIPSLLYAESGGNPLFSLELLAAYLDRQIIAYHRDTLLLQGTPDSIGVPGPIAHHIDGAFASLSIEELALVELIAASDDALTTSAIALLSGMESEKCSSFCERARQRGLLHRDVGKEDSRYSVASNLIRAEAVKRIPPSSRAEIHERLARFYLSFPQDDRSLESAALNFTLAGLRQEAITYCTQAASRAEKRSDYSCAARYQRLALDQNPAEAMQRIVVTLDLVKYLCRLGQLVEAWDLLKCVPSNESVPNWLRARIGIWRARCAKFMGDFARCEHAARDALLIARTNDLAPESIESMLELGFVLCWLDRPHEGKQVLFKAVSEARRSGLRTLAGEAMLDIASSHWKAGNYRLALNYQRRFWRILRAQGKFYEEATTLCNIGVLLTDLGMYSQARMTHRRALEITRSAEMKTLGATSLVNYGETYRSQGRWRAALKHYRSALKVSHGLGAEVTLLATDANIAYALARPGHFSEAMRHLKHRMQVSRRLGLTQATCFFLVSWAIVLLSTGRYSSTHRVTALACRLAEGAGLWGLILELKIFMAFSIAAGGKLEDAQSLLSGAIQSYSSRAPFDVSLSGEIAIARIEQSLGAKATTIEARLMHTIEKARAKKMRWHLASALMVWTEGLLTANRLDEAEVATQEARRIAESIADRTLYWQANHLLGRAFEQRLQYERALNYYRVAALTIHELAMNLEEEKYRAPFLAQPNVREVLERYDRLRGEVGKRVRHDLAAMSRSEKISRRMLGALNAIGQRLASILDLDELLKSLLDLSVENVRAERGIVFLRDEKTGAMCMECARGMDKASLEEVTSFSRSVVRQVAHGQTLLTVDVGKDRTLSAFKSLVLHEIKSILCVPMRARGKVVGVIYLDTRRAAQLFTDKERAFVEAFASQAAIAIENARQFGQINAENSRLRKEVEGRSCFESLIGTSPAMRKLTEVIASVLNSDCGVLIVGESGTGKELVARAIHYNGPRRKKDFVAIDCGALPENLLEAELFGYVRGAFTGADKDRIGLIEQAHGGTLFLDEITNTSLALQARLLRMLQEREVRRVGENTPRQVDVRVVTATNADIKNLVTSGRFRRDLYYRLDVITIDVPALRERREDIPLLVEHFLQSHAPEGTASKRVGPGVLQVLSQHDWPGNVRELQNIIQRLMVLSTGNVISVDDLPKELRKTAVSPEDGPNGNGAKTGEQLMIEDALKSFGGDKAKAARFIGWNRQKLYRRMKTFGIPTDYGQSV